MAHTSSHTQKPSVASLLSGIVADAQTLLAQELIAARLEVEYVLLQKKKRAIRLGFGIGVSAIAAVLLAFMFVHGLVAYTTMPLWGCYGLIGGLLAAVGIALCSSKKGSSKNEVVVVPTPTTQVVKEDRG